MVAGPRRITAGQRVCLRVRYTHEGEALGPGAAIRVGYNVADGAGRCQADAPDRTDFVRVESGAGSDVAIASVSGRRSITYQWKD